MNRKLFPLLAAMFAITMLWSYVPDASGLLIEFDYTAGDSDGTVQGSFGYDDSASDRNSSTDYGSYLTGFFNGTVSGGTQDGFMFDYNLSGAEAVGNMFTVVNVGDEGGLDLDPESLQIIEYLPTPSSEPSLFNVTRVLLSNFTAPPVFPDDSLPAALNLSDFETGNDRAYIVVGDVPGARRIYSINTLTPATAPVPEPATILLIGTGLVGFAIPRIRKKFKK